MERERGNINNNINNHWRLKLLLLLWVHIDLEKGVKKIRQCPHTCVYMQKKLFSFLMKKCEWRLLMSYYIIGCSHAKREEKREFFYRSYFSITTTSAILPFHLRDGAAVIYVKSIYSPWSEYERVYEEGGKFLSKYLLFDVVLHIPYFLLVIFCPSSSLLSFFVWAFLIFLLNLQNEEIEKIFWF